MSYTSRRSPTSVVDAGIIVLGGLGAFTVFVPRALRSATTRGGSYEQLRCDLGRCILLGLEIQIVADTEFLN
jgi:uncharacterized membrane protein